VISHLAAPAVNEAAGNAREQEGLMEYEFVQDHDGIEHVVRRPGAAFERIPVCDDLDTALFDGPEPALCEECRGWVALHGNPALLAAAVAGARARWLTCQPGTPVSADVEPTP
jgi:hypothetical protein